MEVQSSKPRVSWSPTVSTRRRIAHDGGHDYQQINLEELSDFKDLEQSETTERGSSSTMYRVVWTREDRSKKEVVAKRLNKLDDKEVK